MRDSGPVTKISPSLNVVGHSPPKTYLRIRPAGTYYHKLPMTTSLEVKVVINVNWSECHTKGFVDSGIVEPLEDTQSWDEAGLIKLQVSALPRHTMSFPRLGLRTTGSPYFWATATGAYAHELNLQVEAKVYLNGLSTPRQQDKKFNVWIFPQPQSRENHNHGRSHVAQHHG
ncbi:hypothetical protein I302_103871 [Kwoniella bestiolae CBS 10118]|uniref:Uncharacterized protein n=1 Tax=Kwoniella bestiolae CBS 10118 TaxID=1296100 RepID=A0A1B9G9L7_9TREE|nr:hypothetical protein I302_02577 [Kwoniella bestiolae CBS 10118]OCF27732.1 hypothetical protein I302_02577 [Kwoniella bestiolae CBS 10118]